MNQNKEIGICCFCAEECNIHSQSCGRCSRILTGFSMGWNSLPLYLQYNESEVTENHTEEKTSKKNKYEPTELLRSKRNRKNDK